MLGRVSRIDYPEHPISHGRMRACYEYGTAGYITGISVQVNTNGILPGFCNKDIVENITYNEFGQTAGFELGNGIETTYTYDIKGRMVRIHSSGDVGGSTKVLQDAVYSFNNKNDIVGITNATGEFNSQYDYDYDGIGRLTNAIGNYVETADNLGKRFRQSYSYAKNGNLIAKRIHDPTNSAIQDEWTYQYTNHQVTNIDSSKTGTDTFTLQYDANGNLTRQRDNAKDLTKRISVDSQDRIVQIQDANNAILGSYWYDEGGFRVRSSALEPKNNQFTNVEILYPSKFYGLEYIESENVVTSVNNVYLNGVRIAALNEAGALAYFLTDQVDSVSHVLDDEGNTLSRMQYLPYGDTFVHKGDTNFAPKYNSQELDRESGFYFYNARYYDPGIARFTSADTIIDGESDTQGWNRFSYVRGNPIGAKDPTGHEIYIAGNNDAYKKEVLEDLSKLSGSKLEINDKGKVTVKKEVSNSKTNKPEIPKKPYGNKLVNSLINSNKAITINETYGGNGADAYNRSAAQNGKGSNSTINYNPKANPKIPTRQKDGTIQFEGRPKEIGLAHELIHTDHLTNGTADATPVIQTFTAKGNKYQYEVMKEELRTVGVAHTRKGDVTENRIRKENGLKPRAAY